MDKSVTTFTSPVDSMVIEFTEWNEDGVHRIQSRVVGEMPTYGVGSSASEGTLTTAGVATFGGPEAVNVEVQKRLQENFLRSRGLIWWLLG